MSEAAMNPVVVLVWHSSVVAVVWHRGQRRCLGGDLTLVLACLVFLLYCFPYHMFRTSLLGKVWKDFEDSTEPSGWAYMMAVYWAWKQRAMPAWHQSHTGKLSPISCWACGGLCAALQAISRGRLPVCDIWVPPEELHALNRRDAQGN